MLLGVCEDWEEPVVLCRFTRSRIHFRGRRIERRTGGRKVTSQPLFKTAAPQCEQARKLLDRNFVHNCRTGIDAYGPLVCGHRTIDYIRVSRCTEVHSGTQEQIHPRADQGNIRLRCTSEAYLRGPKEAPTMLFTLA